MPLPMAPKGYQGPCFKNPDLGKYDTGSTLLTSNNYFKILPGLPGPDGPIMPNRTSNYAK